jgi:patatin-like phospholipase/acyl hydrolase
MISYLKYSFPLFHQATKIIGALLGPKYNGKYLHSLVKEKLGNTRMHQTLTNVVIPTFDIKQLQPTIFSSFKVKIPSINFIFSCFLHKVSQE